MTQENFKPRKEKAQGMVEFALTLPLLLLLVFGVIEFGRLLFYYGAVVTATREAARYGSAAGDVGAGIDYYEDCAGIMDAAKRIGSLVGIQDGDIQITYDRPGSTNPFAPSCPPSTSVKLADRIIVTVTGRFQPIVPLVNVPPIDIQSVARRTIVKDVEVK